MGVVKVKVARVDEARVDEVARVKKRRIMLSKVTKSSNNGCPLSPTLLLLTVVYIA